MANYKGASRYGTDDAAKAAPRNDAYTGLLIVSLVGMLASCILLYVDYSSLGATPPLPLKPPDLLKVNVPAAAAKEDKKEEKKDDKKEEKKDDKKEEKKDK